MANGGERIIWPERPSGVLPRCRRCEAQGEAVITGICCRVAARDRAWPYRPGDFKGAHHGR